MYYKREEDYLVDVIRFIKNIMTLEVPEYLKIDYIPIIKQLRPYDESFVAREFFKNERFKTLFNEFAKSNGMKIGIGSLLISSENPTQNLILTRQVSEKTIFPIMNQVTGEDKFRDIVNKELEKVKI